METLNDADSKWNRAACFGRNLEDQVGLGSGAGEGTLDRWLLSPTDFKLEPSAESGNPCPAAQGLALRAG